MVYIKHSWASKWTPVKPFEKLNWPMHEDYLYLLKTLKFFKAHDTWWKYEPEEK